uniref:Glycoside hydrolase family 3 protein n=1 Tax=Mycena chlorophos TaxID=658473 RepID=A0ABQ0LAF5_MYCCL|nr:glycoside hydrolase family 3 protein [Mycena chlorophos]
MDHRRAQRPFDPHSRPPTQALPRRQLFTAVPLTYAHDTPGGKPLSLSHNSKRIEACAAGWAAFQPRADIDGSVPVYNNPDASIEDRVANLLPRMTVQEKVAQIIQGDIMYYIANPSESLDETLAYNLTGLQMMNEDMSGALIHPSLPYNTQSPVVHALYTLLTNIPHAFV